MKCSCILLDLLLQYEVFELRLVLTIKEVVPARCKCEVAVSVIIYSG